VPNDQEMVQRWCPAGLKPGFNAARRFGYDGPPHPFLPRTPVMGIPEQTPPAPAAPVRLTSVDAFRGLVMFLMMAEILKFGLVGRALPGNSVWAFLAFPQSPVGWVGCSLHALIQPSFSFLVGVSLPFSLAARRDRGQSKLAMSLHAFWRAFVLVWLG